MIGISLPQQLHRIGETPDHTYDQSLGLLKRIFGTLDPDYLTRDPAAVCVLFRGRDFENAEVLLTLRSATVSTHASQVAYPGGLLDPEDEHDPRRGALRECREEVGIPESAIRPHAVLEAYPTFGGSFLVHPVICSLCPDAWDVPIRPQPEEVVLAEWVPVAALIRSRQVEERVVHGQTIQAPFFLWGEHRVWGLSAWILDSILTRFQATSMPD
jgi:8-oxo-dGTP pyrophosphatase MutT (NUDIX family)